MLTEQRNPQTLNIDQLDTLAMLQLINAEDATVAPVIATVLPAIAQAVDTITKRLRSGGRLFYMGAGTSGRLGVLDAVECVPTFNTDPDMIQGIVAGGFSALTQTAEYAEDDRQAGFDQVSALHVGAQDVVVGIAASGHTPYVLGALEAANQAGAATIGIACNAPAPILDSAQIAIPAVVGPEVITGSTRLKAGTAQKMILNMLSTASMIQLGKVYGNLMVDVKVSNEKLALRAQRIVCEVTGISPATADELLAQSDNEAKTAITMALLDITAAVARTRLAAAGGVLHTVIGQR
ncbi:N-acetylmuramic acid 6-phosphate etherase [Chloroflexota bacterium]